MKKSVLKQFVPNNAKANGTDKVKEQKIRYAVKADIFTADGKTILRTTIFSADNGMPIYCIFCSKTDFITWDYKAGKWSEAIIDKFSVTGYEWIKLQGQYHTREVKRYTYADQDSVKIGSAFFCSSDDTVSLIEKFERGIRDAATSKRHETQRNYIGNIMSQARPLPKHFSEWVDRVPLAKSRYLYYKRQGKTAHGYCTVCGKDVILSEADARHNKPAVCPNCHAELTCKAIGMSRHITDMVRVEYIQRIRGSALMVREIDITKEYDGHYRNPEYTFYEGSRHIVYADGRREKYIPNHNTFWLGEWRPYSKDFEYYATLYTPGLLPVIKSTTWQYSAISLYAKYRPAFAVAYYLSDSVTHPCIEYFCKIGLMKLLDERQGFHDYLYNNHVNWDGKTLREALKIRNDLIQKAAYMNISSDELEVMQFATEADIYPDDQQVEWLSKRNILWRKSELLFLLSHMTLFKIQKYAEKVQMRLGGENIGQIIGDWSDYLHNADLLGYNLHSNAILFPNDLKKAHDKLMKLSKAKKDKIVDEKLKQLSDEMSRLYGFRNGDYIVQAPSCFKDLLVEGEKLKHCVASYAQKMAMKETVILFVRRADAPDEPFVTVEVRNGHVLQVRGFKNHDPEPEVMNFVGMWEKKKLLQPRQCA